MNTNKKLNSTNSFFALIIIFLMQSMIFNRVEATNYYVSAKGNDTTSGRTPSSSWLTIKKVNSTPYYPGDSILFKRGDAWRGGQSLYGSSNGTAGHPIVFGAYGTGAKPLILASKDLSSSTFWINSSENIWKTTSVINITTFDGRRQVTPDVANLIFNNEESIGVKRRFLEDLQAQGNFCLNLGDTILYLYSTINPSKYYKKIEAGGIRNCENNIEVMNGHYLTFDNLDIRYSKNNGLFLQDCSNIEIKNCDFSWLGGCYFPIDTFMNSLRQNPGRMGNGVQIWMGNSDVTVKYCNFNQIYDAGISPQGGHAKIAANDYAIKNLRFHHNFIDNCVYSFEFWGHQANSTGDSIYFENNTCVNSGKCWSTSQRPDKGRATHLQFSISKMVFSNVFIRNNIFAESVDFCSIGKAEYDGSGTDAIWSGITIDYNCYYKSSNEKPLISWRGGTSNGGGDYFKDDLKAYQTKTGKELHSIFANPILTSKYTLKSDSPAIDTGIDVGYPYTGTSPDMGAFEFTGDRNNRQAIRK